MSDTHSQKIFRTGRQVGKSSSMLSKESLVAAMKNLPFLSIKHSVDFLLPPGIAMNAVIEWGEPWRSELSVMRKRAGLAEPVGANFNVDHALADLRKRLRHDGTGGTGSTGPTGAQGSSGTLGVAGPTGTHGSSDTLYSIGNAFWVHVLPPAPPACESSDDHELGHVELGDVDAHTLALLKVNFD